MKKQETQEKNGQNTSLVEATSDDLVRILEASIFPGASPDSIRLALGYCKAAGLDVMQKPVHIVPMWNAAYGRLVDQIIPGIGLYRIQAARTREYGGVSEPEFGPIVDGLIGGQKVTYPEWAKVTVIRLLPSGNEAKFTSVERWIECYVVKGGKDRSIAPNAMWSRRPFAQLAKCAEAQALRKAFPEVGSQPTLEEVDPYSTTDFIVEREEGGFFEHQVVNEHPKESKKEIPILSNKAFDRQANGWKDAIDAGQYTLQGIIDLISQRAALTEEQLSIMQSWVAEGQHESEFADNNKLTGETQ
jgi:phage recombination protein Bet